MKDFCFQYQYIFFIFLKILCMDNPQPATPSSYQPVASAPGILGTKAPSVISFTAIVLLFLMPFLEIRCNGMKIQSVSGLQLATGFKTENSGGGFGGDTLTKTTTNTDKQHPNTYALAALALGVVGLILCLMNKKATAGGAMAAAVLGVAAMVGLYLDIKKQMNNGIFNELSRKTKDTGGEDTGVKDGFEKIGEGLSNLSIKVDFAPVFYIVVVLFAVAAFFSFSRMRQMRE